MSKIINRNKVVDIEQVKKFAAMEKLDVAKRVAVFSYFTNTIKGIARIEVRFVFALSSDCKFGYLKSKTIGYSSKAIDRTSTAGDRIIHCTYDELDSKLEECLVDFSISSVFITDNGHMAFEFNPFPNQSFDHLEALLQFTIEAPSYINSPEEANLISYFYSSSDKRIYINSSCLDKFFLYYLDDIEVKNPRIPIELSNYFEPHNFSLIYRQDNQFFIPCYYDFSLLKQFNLFDFNRFSPFHDSSRPLLSPSQDLNRIDSYRLSFSRIYELISSDENEFDVPEEILSELKEAYLTKPVPFSFDNFTILSKKMYAAKAIPLKQYDFVECIGNSPNTRMEGLFVSYTTRKTQCVIQTVGENISLKLVPTQFLIRKHFTPSNEMQDCFVFFKDFKILKCSYRKIEEDIVEVFSDLILSSKEINQSNTHILSNVTFQTNQEMINSGMLVNPYRFLMYDFSKKLFLLNKQEAEIFERFSQNIHPSSRILNNILKIKTSFEFDESFTLPIFSAMLALNDFEFVTNKLTTMLLDIDFGSNSEDLFNLMKNLFVECARKHLLLIS